MGYVASQVSFRIEQSKIRQLDQIAKALDRDRSYVLNEAVDNYLDLHRWQLEQIEAGIADAEAGRTYSTDEVKEHLKRYMDEFDAFQRRVDVEDLKIAK